MLGCGMLLGGLGCQQNRTKDGPPTPAMSIGGLWYRGSIYIPLLGTFSLFDANARIFVCESIPQSLQSVHTPEQSRNGARSKKRALIPPRPDARTHLYPDLHRRILPFCPARPAGAPAVVARSPAALSLPTSPLLTPLRAAATPASCRTPQRFNRDRPNP